MKERGILFSAPLVRALLAGTKTQTRRLIKPQPVRQLPNEKPMPSPSGEPWTIKRDLGWRWQRSKDWSCFVADNADAPFAEYLAEHCPYGRRGDRLWVRETWYDDNALRGDEPPPSRPDEFICYRADGEASEQFEQLDPPGARIWRPSIFMPRWASRITLEVTEVRVQRLQDISEEDRLAEGLEEATGCFGGDIADLARRASEMGTNIEDSRVHFAQLWDTINGERASWASNPWVWCLSFRRLP